MWKPKDPLHRVKHRPRLEEALTIPIKRTKEDNTNVEKSEKLLRERSIRSNRRHKFVDCLTSQDVNIGTEKSASPCCLHLDFPCYSRTTQAGMGRYTSRLSIDVMATASRKYYFASNVNFCYNFNSRAISLFLPPFGQPL